MDALFIETLRSWQNFYFMSGGAAGGLLGLMFVALSLGIHLISDVTLEGFKIFVTPSILYFVSALLISCVMLVPTYTPPTLALLLFLGGVFGLGRTLQHVRQLIRVAKQNQDFNLADWLAQIILPVLSYSLLLIAAVCLVVDQWPVAFMALWLAEDALLICGIANTWGLVLWIIEQG